MIRDRSDGWDPSAKELASNAGFFSMYAQTYCSTVYLVGRGKALESSQNDEGFERNGSSIGAHLVISQRPRV
ncbi:MAG: hypothetical protein D6690_17750 [Nitrospirae bacterium]|nr:MAG: hypothetical protein D6690_17750 [Nitrospirota bacterium]